jgi:hypothetical protein
MIRRLVNRRLSGDAGSLILALLLVVMVGALIPVVVISVVAERKVTARDRSSGIALEAADAGIQDARYRLINRIVLPRDVPVTPGYVEVTGEVNAVPYRWRAKPVGTPEQVAAGINWRVVSVGGKATGARRTVRATLNQQSLFSHALFINSNASLGGGNTVDSYNSALLTRFTGSGYVSSNGNLDIPGNNTADRVNIYDWQANPGPSRCVASGSSTPLCVLAPSTGPTIDAKRFNYLPRFPLPQQTQAVEEQLAACSPAERGRVWKASVHNINSGTTFNLPAGTHCFASMEFDVNTVFPGPPRRTDSTSPATSASLVASASTAQAAATV